MSDEHLAAARSLVEAGLPGVSPYLAGLSVECALKAVIARQFEAETWPPKHLVRGMFEHDFSKLRALAKLDDEWALEDRSNPAFRRSWRAITRWSVDARYSACQLSEAEDMIEAVASEPNGVRPWIARFW